MHAIAGQVRLLMMLTATCWLWGTLPAAAQGFLLPENPDLPHWRRPVPHVPVQTYRVDKIEVDASIQDQVATVQVAQTFRNTCSQTLKVRFVFPLPYDGAIDQMTFLVDGDELPGKLMEADQARKKFADYVRRMQDPALVEWMGMGMFQTQVFPVPPGAERTVSLRYTQLLRRSGSMTDWMLPLKPAASQGVPVGKINVSARIRSNTPLANVYSPTHDVSIKKPDARTAEVKFNQTGQRIEGNLRILWDTAEDPLPMSMVGYRENEKEDGYFMLLLQPDLPEPSNKDRKRGKHVVLVLDKSGSMKQKKIEQARDAAQYVLGQLKPRDQFELITYDNGVEAYSGSLTAADQDSIADASDYVASILAGGGTNIHEALQTALQTSRAADDPAYIVFMTDGRPTAGITDVAKIVAEAKQANKANARVLSLGVGHDVNSRLLDKLSAELFGQTIYVSPGEAIDDHVRRLYDRIGAPALTDVKLTITVDGKKSAVRQLYPQEIVDVFSGDQVVVVGRYRQAGEVRVELSGQLGDAKKTFTFRDSLPDAERSRQRNQFVERLWAVRRIGSIIDEIDLHGEQAELVDELVALSKKHGVLTPYTAFLADEEVALNDRVTQQAAARSSLGRLQAESGADAFRQRAAKGVLKQAARPSSSDRAFGDFAAPSPAAGQGAGGRGQQAANAINTGPIAAPAKPGVAAQPAMQLIAGKTFFLRNGILIDAQATDKQIANPEKVTQFSDRYFELVDLLKDDQKAWLAQNQPLLVVVKEQAYQIMPAK